jgi:hypothetical protein
MTRRAVQRALTPLDRESSLQTSKVKGGRPICSSLIALNVSSSFRPNASTALRCHCGGLYRKVLALRPLLTQARFWEALSFKASCSSHRWPADHQLLLMIEGYRVTGQN